MCAGSNPGHLSVNGFRVHVADRGEQTASARTEDVRRWPVAGRSAVRVGHAPRVLHDGHERVGEIDGAIAVRRRRDRQRSAIFERAGRAAPGDVDDSRLRGGVREAIEIAQVVGVVRREDPARYHDRAGEDRRDRIEALALVVREPEAAQVFVGDDRGAARCPYPHFQVAEAVEGIGAAAGGDAAAVLRPGRRVLDVPELSVERRQSRQCVDAQGGQRQRPDQADCKNSSLHGRHRIG